MSPSSHILIVDDQPDNLLILEDLLGVDHTVHTASRGRDALDYLAAGGVADLILLDVMMPDLDGYEVCRRLKANPATREIPVIFLTALNSIEAEEHGLSLGAGDFIHKPFSPPVVLARIRNHLELSENSRRLRKHGENLECLVAERTADLQATNQRLRETQLALEAERLQLEQRVEQRTDELRAANAALARAARLKDEFLASMSHELRTPLTAILGLTEALLEQVYGPLPDKILRMLKMIEDSGHHLLTLINDILDLAKIEAGQVELDLGRCVLAEVGQASLDLVKGMAGKKRQRIEFAITPPGLVIQADSRRLKQMLVNLLSNAVKFTPEAGRIGLEIAGDPAAGVVRLAVWDTGIGIAAEDMPRLFQSFVQLDSRLERQYEGTGLGLALVRRLTELHGGGIHLESQPGQGSRFTLTLPWRPPNPDGNEPISARLPAVSGPPDLRTPPVGLAPPGPPRLLLLAEDNPVNLTLFADYLTALGYRVAAARDGAEAIVLAQDLRPDVILMDIQMPGMDGLEATRRLRASANPSLAAIPIIALTALTMPGDRERCLAAGATGYLSKPVHLNELAALVRRHLPDSPAGSPAPPHT